MITSFHSVLTLHTDLGEHDEKDVTQLKNWMLTVYDNLDDYSSTKLTITINKSTFGIHRTSKNLHGHIALVYDVKTFKRSPQNYTDLNAFKSALIRMTELHQFPSPFDTKVKNKYPHMSIKYAENEADDHLSYVLKEYESYNLIEFKSNIRGITPDDLEARREFANKTFLKNKKANEYNERYIEKQNNYNEKITDCINIELLPNENKPVTLYVNVIEQLTIHICCDDEDAYKNVSKIAKIPNIAYIYSLKLMKNPKNRIKLIHHFTKQHIPKCERVRDELNAYTNTNIMLAPEYEQEKYLKLLNKLTSK